MRLHATEHPFTLDKCIRKGLLYGNNIVVSKWLITGGWNRRFSATFFGTSLRVTPDKMGHPLLQRVSSPYATVCSNAKDDARPASVSVITRDCSFIAVRLIDPRSERHFPDLIPGFRPPGA
jgi:hypothetical protein